MKIIYENWRDKFLDKLKQEKIFLKKSTTLITSNINIFFIKKTGWKTAAMIAIAFECRWVAIWAKQINHYIQLSLTLELNGQYLVLRTQLALKKPEIISWSAFYAAANRPERHIHDLFGVIFLEHIDFKRWLRHKAWDEKQYPLRKDFVKASVALAETPPDNDYPFVRFEGSGVCEIPVGPIHAGIIEPGHFRFQIAGEDVLHLEERLGYVHKGVEKLAEGMDVNGLLQLAGRISGDSTVAYAWATSQACEHAVNFQVAEAVLLMRAIMLERERIANHLNDVGAICNDVGFAFAYYQFGRLRELCLRLNEEIFGHRLMMDCIIFGGVKKIITANESIKIQKQIVEIKHELTELMPILANSSSLQDRIKTTGILTVKTANKIGAIGYVGRASGQVYDVRKHAAYFPYNQVVVKVPVLKDGDVAARLKIRFEEITISLDLITIFLQKLATQEIQASSNFSFASVEGVGLVESWRGELLVYVSFAQDGKVERYYARDASWLNWPALEYLIHGNIVPDFPVCNKSVNGSYSGHDL